MIFIGQKHVMEQLKFLLPHLYKDINTSANFLLRAASGQGKTRLALEMCAYLVDANSGETFKTYLGEIDSFNPAIRVHFIDEAHMVKDFERLYPSMDSGKYIFIIATNEHTHLAEPVINRCYDITFVDYTDMELKAIINTIAIVNYPDDYIKYLIKSGGRNPRIILSLISRLNIYFQTKEMSVNVTEFKGLLKQLFGIIAGIDPIAASYLQILSNLGGTASVSTISGLIRIDTNTLQQQIEPRLLQNKLIRITSKGRTLCLK